MGDRGPISVDERRGFDSNWSDLRALRRHSKWHQWTESYTWDLSDWTLPDGLVLDSLSGVLSGVPQQSGMSQLTLSLTDGLDSLDFREISLMILGAPNAIDDLIVIRNRNSIILTWDPVPNATGYTVYRSDMSTAPFDSIATVVSTDYINLGIIASQSNCFYQVTTRRDWHKNYAFPGATLPKNIPTNIQRITQT